MQPPVRDSRHISGITLITAAILLTAASLIMVSILPGKDTGGYNKKAMVTIHRLDAV
jgi:hypothetical protein